jgi:hypothetical protein
MAEVSVPNRIEVYTHLLIRVAELQLDHKVDTWQLQYSKRFRYLRAFVSHGLDAANAAPGKRVRVVPGLYLTRVHSHVPADRAYIVDDGKAETNDAGVTWARSRHGKLHIAVGLDQKLWGEDTLEVWALHAGTHDRYAARQFTGDTRVVDARAYANQLWADN